MRLPPFEYYAPESLERILAIKGQFGASAVLIAGGTDLVVNLKHRVITPAAVISIKNVKELRGIEVGRDALAIAAGATLAEVAEHPAVIEHFPVLVRAIRSIGAVGIQWFRGTIGGNICLSPRCLFYNQSFFWRSGKGSCHRTGGKECSALPGSESCQAVCSADTVPVLLALSAITTIRGVGGERAVPIAEFFTGKGESPFNLSPDEVLTSIRIPLPWAPISGSYQRFSVRAAVDFPLANAACVAIRTNGKIDHFRLVVSALGPSPLMLREAEAAVNAEGPTEKAAEAVGALAARAAEGIVVENAYLSRQYRIKLARVMAYRAAREALRV
jgi:4-hydroxybenzoyl-CoA reductase subunit beta